MIALGLLLAAAAPGVPGLHYYEWLDEKDRSEDAAPESFKFVSYFFTRVSATNQLADPSGLKGVSLGPIGIGSGIGSATRVASETESFYVEQRWIPVLSFSPDFVDGLAAFRAQFEVDFMWGQGANQLQHNQGGGFNADQVNIQTKNVNVALYPTRSPGLLAIHVGTQSVYDSIYDPTITSLFHIVRTGYKLTFLGSDATGVSVYGRYGGIWKASFLPFGLGQPDLALRGDARFSWVYLLTADYAYMVQPGTVIGASFWHLQDDSKGSAFAYSGLVPSGPGASLASFTGTQRFNIEQASGSVEYFGAHFHHNVDFDTSDFGASGFVMANFGRYTSAKSDTKLNPAIDIGGVAANLELMWKYGRSEADVLTLEALFTSGDPDPSDDHFSSAFTMNNYGLPGAVWFNHKTLILFPFTQTVSNYTGGVTDISNQGFGLVTAIGAAAYDLVPETLNLKIGAAYAQAAVRPPNTAQGIERGRTVGAEVNVELRWHIRYLMTVGAHFGYLALGNFYDGNPEVAKDPWAAFTTFTWYAF